MANGDQMAGGKDGQLYLQHLEILLHIEFVPKMLKLERGIITRRAVIVAHYFPTGNVVDSFNENVLRPKSRKFIPLVLIGGQQSILSVWHYSV